MRIAHVLWGRCNPESTSGIDRMVYFLSRSQAALGHEVAIFAVTSKAAIPVEGVEVFTQPAPPWPYITSRLLGDRLRAWNPDVTHLHSLYVPTHTSLGRRLSSWHMPYVVTPHGGLAPHILQRRSLLKRSYRALFELSYLNKAAFIHSVSEKEEVRRYGVTAPVVNAPNGVNVADVPSPLDCDVIERRYPVARGGRVFVAIGRLDVAVKGLDLLLRAFVEAIAIQPHLFLVLAGPNLRGGRERLERMIRDAGLEERIVFWGPTAGREKFDLLAAADIFVQASRSEGISLSVLEALASGRTCLVTTAADPLGMIAARNAGLVTAPSVDELRDAIIHLAALSDEELAACGERGKSLARAEFEWKAIAQTLSAAYRTHARCR